MKYIKTRKRRGNFVLLGKTRRSQAAIMILKAGKSTGGPDNRHPKSDQWLFVVSGKGKAIVKDNTVKLKEGGLLLIEAGEAHQITNTGNHPLRTVTFYAPPAY
jgi:mannose-6-phosphate isomerase-like protein (cupin superfamily)